MNQHFKRGFNKGMARGAAFAAVFLFSYLSFAFALWDWNASNWSAEYRTYCMLIGWVIAPIVALP
jgi:hypothetical protein